MKPPILLDIDGTLLRRSLEHWFVRYLIMSGKVGIGRLATGLARVMEWPPHAYRLKLFYLHNQPEDVVAEWIEQAWRSAIQMHIFHGWPKTMEWLRQHDFEIILISGTPRPLAQPLMAHFGLQTAICAEPEILHGRYSGRLLQPHPRGIWKYKYTNDWLQAHDRTLEGALAIANDWPDRHLLSTCHAAVVQPRQRLRTLAAQKGWPVVGDPDHAVDLIEAIQRLVDKTSQ